MSQSKKIITVQGREIGGDQPLICTPLVGSNIDQIRTELNQILPKRPDMIEWRADFFEFLDDTQAVIDTAIKIRETVGQIPVLFTIRSHKEGGQPISIEEKAKIELISEVCRSKHVDLIDYELCNEMEDIHSLRQVSKECGVYMIMSHHNFQCTPDDLDIVEKLCQAENLNADMAKVAVMPNTKEDVLVLMKATEEARKRLAIPLITISMGGYGAITRIAGWFFGSDVTFAIGEKSSAPGQIPIEDLRVAIQIMQRSI